MGEDSITGETVLTDSAMKRFNGEVTKLMTLGLPEINADKLLCFKVPPVKFANLIDLNDKDKYPDYHKFILGTFLEIAKALDFKSDFKFLPILFDPIAFGLAIGIPDLNIKFPPQPPDLPNLILDIPDLAIKIPKLGFDLKAPIPPDLGFKMPKLPELPTLAFSLKIWFDLILKLPELLLELVVKIPTLILNFPKFPLCDIFGKLLPPNATAEPLPGTLLAGAVVLIKSVAECSVLGAIGGTLGASPDGAVGTLAKSYGYTPATGAAPPPDKYVGKTLLAVEGLEGTSTEFRKAVIDLAEEFAEGPGPLADNFADWMVTVFSFETAHTFSPRQRPIVAGPKITPTDKVAAVGLIQFTPISWKLINKKYNKDYTFDKLYAMSDVEQLVPAGLHWRTVLQQYNNKSPKQVYTSLEKLYLGVFASGFVASEPSAIAYAALPTPGPNDPPPDPKAKKPLDLYTRNKGLDHSPKDGKITVAEISSTIRGVYNGAKKQRIKVIKGTLALEVLYRIDLMGNFDFRSSGKTQEQKIIETLVRSSTPIGIKTPLRLNLGEGTDILVTYDNLVDTVKDNLRNMLQTNWGERLGLYDFGANLRPLMSELSSAENFDGQAIERISGAVGRWMPYVSLENFSSTIDHSDNKNTAHVVITITYSIPTLNTTNQALELNLYAM